MNLHKYLTILNKKGIKFMEKILDEIGTAFKVISSIPVSGDAVDAIAVARDKLRKAYAGLDELNKEKKKAENETNSQTNENSAKSEK